jgi:predicted phage tail protein
MSIKGDVIAVGIAGVVLLAAGWYAKKKLESAVTDAGNAVFGGVSGVISDIGQVFAPGPTTTAIRDAINAPGRYIDGYINAAGQYITGDSAWNQVSWMYRIPKDFGILNPEEGW